MKTVFFSHQPLILSHKMAIRFCELTFIFKLVCIHSISLRINSLASNLFNYYNSIGSTICPITMKNTFLTLFSVAILSIYFLCTETRAQNSRVGVTPVESTPKSNKNIVALIIGISEYQNISDLSFADDDAELFRAFLVSSFKDRLEEENIRFLTNQEATGAAIIRSLIWLKQVAKKGDQVVIYFAGHGGYENLTDFKLGYLLAHDVFEDTYSAGGAVSLDFLEKTLKSFAAKGISTLFIADACHSGKSNGSGEEYVYINNQLALESQGITKILSARGNEVALEDERWGGGHGIFTYYLVRGLIGDADQIPEDGYVNIREIDNYLSTSVARETEYNQNPKIIGDTRNLAITSVDISVYKNFQELYETDNLSDLGVAKKKPNKLESDPLYISFKESIKHKNFLVPNDASSIYYYKELNNRYTQKEQLVIQEELVTSFLDYAQSLINNYLAGLTIASSQEYLKASKMLAKLFELDLLEEELIDYTRSKQLFLESYAFHNDVRTDKIKLSKREEEQRFNEEIDKLELAIELDKNAAYLYHGAALYYYLLDKDSLGYEFDERSLELAPNWIYPKNALVDKETDREKRISLYRQHIQSNPNYLALYSNAGFQLRKQRDYEEAKSILQEGLFKALEDRENTDEYEISRIYNQLGLVHHDLDDFITAIKHFEKAIELNPRGEYLFYNMADSYYAIKDFDKANDLYEKAIALHPTKVGIYSWYANILVGQGKFDEAIKATKKAIELEPKYKYAYRNLGDAYKQKKEYDSAHSAYKKAIEIDPSYADVHNELGGMFYEQKLFKKAIDHYKEAIALDGSFKAIYNEGLGASFRQLAQYDSSIYYFKKSISQNSDHSFASYFHIAYLYMEDEILNIDSAIHYSDQGIKIFNPYLKKGNIPKAIQFFKSNLDEPYDSFKSRYSYYGIGWLHENGYGVNKDMREATKWYFYSYMFLNRIAGEKILRMEETETLDSIKNYVSKYPMSDGGKKFTIPCLLPNGNKKPYNILIVDDVLEPSNPIGHEVQRIKDSFNAEVPIEVIDSFKKLYALAKKNDVSFKELCVYALEAANKEKAEK